MRKRIPNVCRFFGRMGFAFLLLGVFSNTFAQLQILWQREGIDDSSRYGMHVFALGDQNNDGFADWGVSGPSSATGTDPITGRVELFYGGNPPSQEPYRIFRTIPDSIYKVLGGASVGDLNGDGVVDYLITFSTQSSSTLHGRDALYFGGGDPARGPDILFQRAHFSAGRNLTGIGDFNGDGFDDLLDRSADESTTHYVYFGSSDFDTIPDWQVTNMPGTQSALPLAWGDINGDGYSDLLVTYNRQGEQFGIYWGSESPDTIPEVWNQFFSDPSIVASLNADNADEIISGLPGSLLIYLGRAHPFVTPDYTLNVPDGVYFWRKIGIGDFNDDGYQDFLGLTDASNNAWWGQFCVYLGYSRLNPNPVVTIRGRQQPYNLIGPISAAGLGDVNGDGVDDFIVGATHADFDGMRGKAMVFAGDPSYRVSVNPNVSFVPDEISIDAYPNPFNPTTTLSFSLTTVSEVEWVVHDVLGREVMRENLGLLAAGQHSFLVDGSEWASGIYFATLRTNLKTMSVKLAVVK
jgi:hypothetical protein